MMLMDDRPLLDAFRRGDEAALLRIYSHYSASVRRTLKIGFSFASGGQTFRFRGYGDTFELQDILQETFMRAFGERARAGYSGLKPFGPYVMGIARNLVIDDFRRRRREMSLFVPESAEKKLHESKPEELASMGQWSRASNPEQNAIARQQQRLIEGFLDGLDETSRALVRLRFVDGLPQEEVAAELGVDRNRVRRLIREVRLSLLRHMKRHGQISALDANELIGMLTLGGSI
jgi:RNA polymerase sigma-70 factor (ECF subfamily)